MTRIFAPLLLLFVVACGTGSISGPAATTDAAPAPEMSIDAGSDPEPAPCGDGICAADESCESCAADCGECSDCNAEPPDESAPDGIDFASQIQPLLDDRCTDCHGGSGGLTLSSYSALMEGGGHGPVITACDCANSILWQKISANPPFGERMPEDGPYLPDSDITLICDWINQGAGETYDPAACGNEPPPPPEECTEDGCGDGMCSAGETCESCPDDCGTCEPTGENGDDTTPPDFNGVIEVDDESETACLVIFAPATDDTTPAGELIYDVYAGPRDAVDLSEPIATFEASELAADGDNLVANVALPPGQRYDLTVRARDAAGNSDDNTESDDCDLR